MRGVFVDFELTDEQRMLRTTARRFVADVCPAAIEEERALTTPEPFPFLKHDQFE